MESLWIRKIRKIASLHPHYAKLFSKLPITIDARIPTVGLVDNAILVNPYFVSKLTNAQWSSVVIHEINHFLVDTMS